MTWQIELVDLAGDSELLEEILCVRGYRVVKGDDRWVIGSDALDACDDSSSAREIVAKDIHRINQMCELDDVHISARLGAIIETTGDDTTRHHHAHAAITMPSMKGEGNAVVVRASGLSELRDS